MKLLKKIFYGIAILIMLCCIVVLVCALNPTLTQSLATTIGDEKETVAPEVNLDTELEGNQQTQEDQQVPDSPEVTPGTQVQVGYIPPSEDAISLPEQVYGMSGYEPVKSNDKQLLDEEAEKLRDSLAMGDVGTNYTFDTEIYPYYGMLDGELQQLYRQIYANAIEQRESFAPVITVGIERVRDVFEAVYNDHPELFWLETEYSCKYTQKGICLEISLKYNETAEDLKKAQAQFDEQTKLILEGANKHSSDYDKEVFVHDALVKRVEYYTKSDMGQSAYSALVNGKSVCAGYARAFQYLMQQLDIPCYYCTGYSGEDHAWNIVKLNGNYYNVDVTWDDTKPSTYDYFNKTDIDFAKTHVRKSLSVYLPACNGNAVSSGNSNSLSPGEIADSNLQAYINADPQNPLTYPDDLFPMDEEAKAEREKQENLDKAGITEDEVMDDMKEYYADCLKQMVEKGTGQKYFTNVVPASLWPTVEAAYGDGDYEKGYVTEALKKLDMDYFAIQMQVEDLSGGYYRIYHNIVTWE